MITLLGTVATITNTKEVTVELRGKSNCWQSGHDCTVRACCTTCNSVAMNPFQLLMFQQSRLELGVTASTIVGTADVVGFTNHSYEG